uniref:G-protein coupled receptors family 1 profile domain-containing protein n=1 Tax=Scleropages formosus TaxID=113540 RepID=A0A8C9R0P2_SCLFO
YFTEVLNYPVTTSWNLDILLISSRMANNSNSSLGPVELFLQEWQVFIPPKQMKYLQVCPMVSFLAVSPVVPVILAKVLRSPHLQQETRYLLLANALLSDLAFVSVYALTSVFNAAGMLMTMWGCTALLSLLGVLFSAGILSTMVMALDTSLAVLVPLRYLALWPVSRTRRVIGVTWVLSLFFPVALVGAFLWFHSPSPCTSHICSLPLLMVLTVSHSAPLKVTMLLTVTSILVILLLVFCGYVMLYWKTWHSGVWRGEQCSRGRGTFFIHYLHLFLSFFPMVMLVVELLLYSQLSTADLKTRLWVSLIVCNVLLVLPKVLAPYMYGFRYRDLRCSLLNFYGLHCKAVVSPQM